MQRPTRIIVFGVFCLVVGGVSAFNNAMEAAVAFSGPDLLEQFKEMAEQRRPLPEVSEQSLDAQISAQRHPVYRIGQAMESTCSAVMALVLIFTGMALFDGRAWAVKLSKVWAWYAIPAAAISTVLSVRYVLPEMAGATTGAGMFSAAFMLVILWAFPVLLLKQLPTKEVKAYLAWRDKQRAGTAPSLGTHSPGPPALAAPAASDVPTAATPSAPPPPPPAEPRLSDTTWRDDPWNDPNSR